MARTLYAVDAKGGERSSAIICKMPANTSREMATFTYGEASLRSLTSRQMAACGANPKRENARAAAAM
jgi:hypothetical protein